MRTRQKARLEAAAGTPEASGFLSLSGEAEEDEVASPPASPRPHSVAVPVQLPEPDHVVTLSSSLQVGATPDLYFSSNPDKMLHSLLAPDTRVRGQPRPGGGEEEIMKNCVITPDFECKESAPPISLSKFKRKKLNQAVRAASTGGKWFDMKAPQLTPQLKNDLRLLQMRSALDPAHHYKASDSKQLPRYFQVGRVVADSADFYSSRIPRRQRKQTLVDELLSNEEFKHYHKKKYLELQKKFMSGTGRKKTIPLKRKCKKKL